MMQQGKKIIGMSRVYHLAYRMYFQNADWKHRFSCAARLLRHRTGKLTAPIAVMIGVTYRCQCRCVHCGMRMYTSDNIRELSEDEITGLIKNVRKMGAVEITLFGGEPLLREDLSQIISFACREKMFISMDTNGLLLDRERIRSLKNAGISTIKISLDSPYPEEHDRMRGLPGAFDSAISAIRECLRQKVPCVISTYASHENLASGQLSELIELGRKMKVTAVRIIDTTLSGCFFSQSGRLLNDRERNQLAGMLDPGFVFMENLASAEALTHPICSALTRRYVYVSPLGDVQPCCFVPVSYGNIRTEPIDKIIRRMWNSSIMDYGCRRCLMNNPDFRERFVPLIEAAQNLPINMKDSNNLPGKKRNTAHLR